MAVRLLMEVFKYPLSNRVYLRIALASGRVVPRHHLNDCNYSQQAIDSDLERFVKVGLVKEVEGGYKLA